MYGCPIIPEKTLVLKMEQRVQSGPLQNKVFYSFSIDQHIEWDFYSASSLKQQSAGGHVAPLTRTNYSDSEPSSLCYYSLMLRA